MTLISGTTTTITHSNLLAVEADSIDGDRSLSYVIVRGPTVGYLQLESDRFVRNLTASGESEFYQRDIADGE